MSEQELQMLLVTASRMEDLSPGDTLSQFLQQFSAKGEDELDEQDLCMVSAARKSDFEAFLARLTGLGLI